MALRWVLGVFALALAACGGAGDPGGRVAPALPQTESAWVELAPQPVEIDGQTVTATCSGAPGTDPAFRFWARRGSGEGLVVYFDGGGACWDGASCARARRASDAGEWGEALYKAELLPSDDPRAMQGLFNLDDARNPVRDWSMVFVPYCTGDVHTGSNTATYADPANGEAYTIQHRGADNFRVVLEWMRDNFNAPDQLLVTGSSAGAYGAAVHYARVREAFPGGRAMMLGDAGQGVSPAGFASRGNETWNYQLPASVFGEGAQLEDGEDIVAQLAAHYPGDRFGQYTTAHDSVQVAYFALMGVANACAVRTQTVAGDLERRGAAENFRSYLAAGDTHTILRGPLFYTEASGGAPFTEWLAAALGEGPWESRSCSQCLAPPGRCAFREDVRYLSEAASISPGDRHCLEINL